MIVWAAIYLAGWGAIVAGGFQLVLGMRRREKKRVILAIVLPMLLWIGIYALHEADRRFIEEETRKNGGRPPNYVW